MKCLLPFVFAFMFASAPVTPVLSKPLPEETTSPEDLDYDTVCVDGQLPDYGCDQNVLPKGFSGNYKDTGIYEIGNKAGDEDRQDTLPLMSLNKDGDYYFTFLITFRNDPKDFAECAEPMKMGFEFVMVDENGNDIVSSVLEESSKFYDIFFLPGEKVSKAHMAEDDSFGMLSIHHKTKTLVFDVMIKQDYKVRYLRVFYGDQPEEVTSTVLCVSYNHLSDAIVSPYSYDCSKPKNTVNVGSSPVFDLQSEYGSVISINYLKDQFIAYDEYDDAYYEISRFEDPDDYFTKGKDADLGDEFQVKLFASDSSGNESCIVLNITVVDTKGPDILPLYEGEEIEESYTVSLGSEAFLNKYFRIRDNYDENPFYTISQENGDPLPVNQIGKFRIVIEATDSFGNKSSYVFVLSLKDDVGPVISSPADEITLSYADSYTEKKLLSLFEAIDDIDGKTELKIIENEYEGNEKIAGKYSVKLQAVDSSGNVTEKEIIIYVKDEEGPVFYAKESFLTLTQGSIPELSEIVSSLVRQEVIPDVSYIDYEIIEGEIISNDTLPGLYEVKLLLETEDGNEITVDLTVKILEKEKEDKTIFDIILEFFCNLFNSIADFFKGLFS